MQIDIIGGGICGLTTALALEKKGYEPNIYEQALELKPVGAGIILAANAMNVYRHLGIEEEIKAKGIVLKKLNITNIKLEAFSTINLEHFKTKYDLQSIVIHRGKLQEILLNNLKNTNINLGYRLEKLTKEKDSYVVNFDNGKTITSTILLGADGIYSQVRNFITTKNTIRNSNQICWRGVTQYKLPPEYKNELNEAWGKGDRFAFVAFEENKLYWYAVKSFKETSAIFMKKEIRSYYAHYAPIVQKIIESTPLEAIHATEMEDLNPINIWYNSNACLIGDAAHATTPNMGQGACQAIEDAYMIAECLHEYKSSKAFEEFQKRRLKTAHTIVNQSWTIGKISHWKNPIAIYLRNMVLSKTPKIWNIRQLENLFQLNTKEI